MGWKLDYFQKVSVFENLSKAQIWPKRKYHLFSHLIWRKFQVFDKGLGNFENLYLRNVIKINYRGGLPTLDFFKKWGSEKNVSQNDKNQSCSKLREMVRKLVETDFWILPRSSEARLLVSEARL